MALLPIGYADGVFRALNGRFEVSINGRRYPKSVASAWTSSWWISAPAPTTSREGDDAFLFGPGTARRADRAGLGGVAGHHQLRGGDQPAGPGRRTSVGGDG